MPNHLTTAEQNFFDFLKIEDILERDTKLMELINSHLNKIYLDDNRFWFNKLCNHGLLNVIIHCEKTIPGCSLYDHRHEPNHLSNVGFIWTIESGNLDLIKYFINNKDFHLFKKRKKIDNDIGNMIQYYKERNQNFNLQNYELLINFCADQFPSAIEPIFDTVSRGNRNDESTPILKNFLLKYKTILTPTFLNYENDGLTLYCMLSVINDNYDFAKLLRKEFQEYALDESRVQVLLYWMNRNTNHFNWMVENPDFFKLETEHFNDLFERIFQSPLKTKIKKEDYDYFNTVVKSGLHKITKDEFSYSIKNNLTPLVKKYYKQFDLSEFKNLSYRNNTCTNFILTKIAEKDYKELQGELPTNNSKSKKIKI